MNAQEKAKDLKAKQDQLAALKAAKPNDAAAIAAKQAEVNAAQEAVNADPVV